MRPEIFQGDVKEVLKEFDDESVQCVITSPPYWGLRDYGTATWEGGDENCEHTINDGTYDPKKGKVVERPDRSSDKSCCIRCGAKRIDAQLGLEPTPEEFVNNLVEVFREVKRVLRDDGTVWLNLGDSYAGSNGSRGITENTPSVKSGDTLLSERIKGRNFTEHKDGGMPIISPKSIGLKHKDLVGIPWRVALALQSDGWYLRSDIIWHKPNPMPEPVKDRPTKSHEYIFLITKSAKYYYDAEAIKEKGSGRIPGNKVPQKGAGMVGFEIRDGLLEAQQKPQDSRNKRSVWKIDKYGDAEIESMYRQGIHRDRGKKLITTRPNLPTQKEFVDFIREKTNAKELSEKSGIKLSTVEHWFRYDESGFAYPSIEDWMIISDFVKNENMHKQMTNVEFHYDSVKSNGANKRSVWSITTKPYSGAHFATFPEELPETCIKAGTKKGDVVLDIFAGSGTTLRVASKLGRKGIGIELNPEYIKILKKRCKIESMSLEAFL